MVPIIYIITNNAETLTYSYVRKGKGKATPLQAWTGPEGSRKLRFIDFKKIGT